MSAPGHFIYTGERLGGLNNPNTNYVVTVTIDDTITKIEEDAFSWCGKLNSITIPETITSIEKFAFSHCDNLKSIIIPSSVTRIEKCAFFFCSNLKSVKIHPSTIIGEDVFRNCPNLDEDSCQQISQQFIKANNLTLRDTFKQGDGPTLGFQGATQNGYGPEMCGITLQQMKDVLDHPLIKPTTLMRDVVRLAIKPITKKVGVGYALLANQDAPLKANIMVSVSVITFANIFNFHSSLAFTYTVHHLFLLLLFAICF